MEKENIIKEFPVEFSILVVILTVVITMIIFHLQFSYNIFNLEDKYTYSECLEDKANEYCLSLNYSLGVNINNNIIRCWKDERAIKGEDYSFTKLEKEYCKEITE